MVCFYPIISLSLSLLSLCECARARVCACVRVCVCVCNMSLSNLRVMCGDVEFLIMPTLMFFFGQTFHVKLKSCAKHIKS